MLIVVAQVVDITVNILTFQVLSPVKQKDLQQSDARGKRTWQTVEMG